MQLVHSTLSKLLVWGPAFTPLVIGSITVYIAWQQWKTNNLKIKHDLYERRLAIFNILMEFLAGITQTGKADLAKTLEFNRKTRDSYFLFDDDIADYLDSVYRKAVDMDCIYEQYPSLPAGEERTRLIKEKTELEKWFGRQFLVAKKKFGKFLRLS